MPKHRSKILSLKGKKQGLTSAERGKTHTIELCFNVAGNYMPPMSVFPLVHANEQLMNKCPLRGKKNTNHMDGHSLKFCCGLQKVFNGFKKPRGCQFFSYTAILLIKIWQLLITLENNVDKNIEQHNFIHYKTITLLTVHITT